MWLCSTYKLTGGKAVTSGCDLGFGTRIFLSSAGEVKLNVQKKTSSARVAAV